MSLNKVWIIVRAGNSAGVTSKFHDTKEDAIKEAEKLSDKENDTFYIYALIGRVKPKPVRPPVEYIEAV